MVDRIPLRLNVFNHRSISEFPYGTSDINKFLFTHSLVFLESYRKNKNDFLYLRSLVDNRKRFQYEGKLRFSYNIDHLFAWSNTPQGHHYWYTVYNSMYRMRDYHRRISPEDLKREWGMLND